MLKPSNASVHASRVHDRGLRGDAEARVGFGPAFPAYLVGAAAALVYLATSAPTITWAHESQDSGELAVCAATLGIAHPTGYPLYTLFGWCLVHLLPMLEPARVMVLFSVVCGAFAVGVIAQAASRAIRLVSVQAPISSPAAGWWGALAAGFAAISPVVWSQSVVCEVYALALLLQAFVWLILIRHLETRLGSGDRSLGGRMFLLGLGLGLIIAHHVAGIGVLIPVVVVLTLHKPPELFRNLLRAFAGLIPGLLCYVYLPIRSAQNPMFDWGNPESWTNFFRHVTGWQYQGLVFGVPAGEFWRSVAAFPWAEHWGILGSLLFLLGLGVLSFSRGRREAKALVSAILLYSLWVIAFASGYRVTDYEVFYYPLAVPACIAIAVALSALAVWLGRVARFLPWALAILAVAILATSAQNRWTEMDVSEPMRNPAALFAARCLRIPPEDALVIAFTDGHTASLGYAVACGITDPITGERLGPRDDVDVLIANMVKYDWFRENVQDRWGLTGRVRFISPSHERDPALRALVDQNLAERPLYVDFVVREIIEAPNHHYEVEPAGPLFRVIAE